MTTTSAPITLRLSLLWAWALGLGGLVLGVGAGFALPPGGHWVLGTFGHVPDWVRIALSLPPVWLVPIAAVLGTLGGLFVFYQGHQESLILTVAESHVELAHKGREQFVPRERIAAVYREDRDLVLTDRHGARLARFDAYDLNRGAVGSAFRAHGYPWLDENDPYGAEFTRWVDGMPGIDDEVHQLLRARRRALADERDHDVEELDEKLADRGVDVRDRNGKQHIRVVEPTGLDSAHD
ncbi:hypothetical protein [Nocardia terpenica]|uniref:DUF308 domain-containing protein n=1 Tax=Nocardia terpenica TaxID=455432 RepID=A0A164JR36_9NOCA|nr:hypothetical protein [Nocardia terpenica]KZM70645.1 hypothetical protein AWN90_39435 [Nocardia terpenica]NQE90098.1 hypothetical protein [Nocardia terpenica]